MHFSIQLNGRMTGIAPRRLIFELMLCTSLIWLGCPQVPVPQSTPSRSLTKQHSTSSDARGYGVKSCGTQSVANGGLPRATAYFRSRLLNLVVTQQWQLLDI